jgi:WG containing repeat
MSFVNRKGELICPLIFNDLLDFKNGKAAVSLNDKWGFIDTTGRLIIPIEFDRIYFGGFLGRYARVRRGDTHGYIDEKGNFVWIDK